MTARSRSQRLELQLYGIRTLEAAQRTIGIMLLIAIGVRSAAMSDTPRTTTVIVSFIVLALVHLGFAHRLRAGGDLVLHDLHAIDGQLERVQQFQQGDRGPYRTLAAPPPVSEHARPLRWVALLAGAFVSIVLTAVAVIALS